MIQPHLRMLSNSCICYYHQQSLLQDQIDETFENILQLYDNDLPCLLSFDSELDLYQHKWASEPQLACELNTKEKCLAHTDSDFFPNIHVLLRIMATIPVTSCECKRSISMLKLVNSPLQSSMEQDRLNGLAMYKYHRDVELSPEEAVQESPFAIHVVCY